MTNPVEDFLLEKKALSMSGVGAQLAPFGRAAGNAAMAGAGAAAFAGITAGAGKLFMAASKSRDFRRMLEANPDLHEHHSQDPAGFNRLYSALHTLAPEFAREPLVAGSYMRLGMENPESARGSIAVKAMGEMKPSRLGPASSAALDAYSHGFKLPEGQRPALQKQVKHIFGPASESGAQSLERTEEVHHHYG